jgi:hypothetical protein
MKLGKQVSLTADDFEYLSYFNVSKYCSKNKLMKNWIEWIEPLTMHARYPFAYGDLSYMYLEDKAAKELNTVLPVRNLVNIDYILFQNGEHIPKVKINSNNQIESSSKYMFDAGTSRFDSSLVWFTCAYDQVISYIILCILHKIPLYLFIYFLLSCFLEWHFI